MRRALLVFAVGLVLGGLGASFVLFDRTGRGALHSVLVRTGMREESGRFQGFQSGEREIPAGALEWEGVRSPAHPDWKVRRGFDVELVATGLGFPVNLAFSGHAEPLLYVNELHGSVKVVEPGGAVSTYASGLNNFAPDPFAAANAVSDDLGTVGLVAVPGSEDLVLTGAYRDEASGLLKNHVLRLVSEPGGRRMARKEVLLDIDEFTTPGHHVLGATIGPDEKLYVSVGDGQNYRYALHLDRFGGKILRANLDGSAAHDNPYYDEHQPGAPRSYVYAYGLRNAFDLDFDPATGFLYATDNGTDLDRLVRVLAGAGYGWDGRSASIRTNALYTWGPEVQSAGPTGIVFPRASFADGPERFYVALFAGAAQDGRSIVELRIDSARGLLKGLPTPLVQYVGNGRRTVLGLAEGADGLYFTDFWGERGLEADRTAAVWRVVRSQATESLPSTADEALAGLTREQRGRRVFERNCLACHLVRGAGGGGTEGPDLSDVARVLEQRLGSPAYAARLAELLGSPEAFRVAQRERLVAVRDAGEDRVTVWLRQHVREPRFDNPYARMPSFDLAEEELEELIAYLLTLR